MSVGGSLDLSSAAARLKPALYASVIKVVILPLFISALSVALGYRGRELLILLVLTAAPVAVSSYAMASEMGGDAPTASNILILTTFASAFSLAFGIYLYRTLGYI
jgi:predicted permease